MSPLEIELGFPQSQPWVVAQLLAEDPVPKLQPARNLMSRIATCLLTLALAFPAASQAEGYHDVSGATHQDKVDELSKLGYRMTSLSIYGSQAKPLYAAIWVQRAGPQFAAFHGLTSAEYQEWAEERCEQGFTPKLLSATGPGGDARFAGVFEKTDDNCLALHNLDFDQLWDQIGNARDSGFRLITADVYGEGADTRFIVGFVPNPEDLGWGGIVSAGKSSFQEHFDAFGGTHARMALAAFNREDVFFSMWTDDMVGEWYSHADLTSDEYQTHVDDYLDLGLYPIHLDAAGSGSNRRFAAIFARDDQILPRVMSASGQVVPELGMFDNWVEDWMKQNDARSASLAIVKDGRLVLTRGYTFAEVDYPATQPTSLFRTASTSKPLTAISMYQHFERMPATVGPNSLMTQYLNMAGALEPNTSNVTLFHLLTHQGGWDRNISGDSTGQDVTVASDLGVPFPLTKFDTRNWVTQNVLMDFVPGFDSQYSNYGMSLVGQVIESLNQGVPYEDVVRRDIFAPLGITRPSIAGSLIQDIRPGEVRYHNKPVAINRSVMTNDRPWVPEQYGGLNIGKRDSHGGWVMAAPDYAKVLAAFASANNPLMTQTTADAMFATAPGFAPQASAWFTYSNFDDGRGGNVQVSAHNGGQPGTSTLVARRADGISFVLFTNSDAGFSLRDDSESLSDLANTVVVWPNHDLFPTVDLPSCKEHVPGLFTSLGEGCRGSQGLLSLYGTGTPEVGQVFDMNLVNGAPPRARPSP